MDNRLHILMADYVPIANKGEEAIVRGIEDMLSDGQPVALGLFDNVPHVTQRENLTIFPRDWLFRCEGNTALSRRGRILTQALIAAQLRCGVYGPLRNLTSGAARCRPLADFFDRAEYVLVGHDGVFGVKRAGSSTWPGSTASGPVSSAPAPVLPVAGGTRPGCTAGQWPRATFACFGSSIRSRA